MALIALSGAPLAPSLPRCAAGSANRSSRGRPTTARGALPVQVPVRWQLSGSPKPLWNKSTSGVFTSGKISTPHLLRRSSVCSSSMAQMSAAEAASPATPVGAVDLGALLKTCEEAAAAAGAVIRKVQATREDGGQDELGAVLKDSDDPRSALTIADTSAQKAVMRILRAQWPELCIIGEEDEDGSSGNADAGAAGPPSPSTAAANAKGSPSGLEASPELRAVDPSAICIFVDPLDGTREFVEGRLDAVQTLIGISVYGRAVGGAVGLPFFGAWKEDGAEVHVVSGLVGSGVAGLPGPRHPRGAKGGLVLTASKGEPKGIMAVVTSVIKADHVLPLGGVGNKVLALLCGEADVGLMHLGTSLWDTCATEGVLRAAGGALTDLHGCPIEHSSTAPIINRLGVIASAGAAPSDGCRTHAGLCAELRASGVLAALTEQDGLVPLVKDGAQATDIARDLDWQPLTAASLSSAVGFPVESYDAPEETACRFMMSEAVRIRLRSSAEDCPPSLFYKRVVMGDLEHARTKASTAPVKLGRDVKSYQVEAAFLGSAACTALVGAGVHVARPYSVTLRPVESSPIDSRFSLLLEDFASKDGWRQRGLLSPDEMNATLETAASLHAFFWSGSNCMNDEGLAGPLETDVWPAGAYWQPSMQPADQMDNIQPGWDSFLAAFNEHLPALQELGVDIATFGERLAAAAPAAAAEIHQPGRSQSTQNRTLIHGDLKSANIFLNDRSGQPEAALIDFQWTGWGLAATDVAYLIASSASAEQLTMEGAGEAKLLERYHTALTCKMAEFGVVASQAAAAELFPLEALTAQYRVALVDVCRLAVAYQWQRIKVSPAVLEANASSLGRVGYNKSLHHALWLVVRTDEALRATG